MPVMRRAATSVMVLRAGGGRVADPQAFAPSATAMAARHVGGGPSSVDEDESLRFQIDLAIEPVVALLQYIGYPPNQRANLADVELILPVAGSSLPRMRHVANAKSIVAHVMFESAKGRQLGWRKGNERCRRLVLLLPRVR